MRSGFAFEYAVTAINDDYSFVSSTPIMLDQNMPYDITSHFFGNLKLNDWKQFKIYVNDVFEIRESMFVIVDDPLQTPNHIKIIRMNKIVPIDEEEEDEQMVEPLEKISAKPITPISIPIMLNERIFDVISGEEIPITDYLEADDDNCIIYDVKNNIYDGFSRDNLKNVLNNPHFLYYKCVNTEEAFDRSRIYFDLKKISSRIFTFVDAGQMKSVLTSHYKIFILMDTPLDPPVNQIGSLNYADYHRVEEMDAELNLGYGSSAPTCKIGITNFATIFEWKNNKRGLDSNETESMMNKRGGKTRKNKLTNLNKLKYTRKHI
jgi:hypothetical protein